MVDEGNNSSEPDDKEPSSFSSLAERVRAGEIEDALDGDSSHSLTELADMIRRREGSELDTETASNEWDYVDRAAEGSDATLDPKTEAVLELVGDSSNILVKGPPGGIAEEGLCARLMESESGSSVNILVVTISETPGQRLSLLETYLRGPVRDTAVVDVRNYDREQRYDQYDGPVDLRPISDPQDLRRIGMVTSKVLSDWGEEADTTLCFHSLSELLRLNEDPERAFRFLHVLTRRVQSLGVRAHYHFDPEKHGNEVIQLLAPLFDTTVEIDEDGSISLP